MALAGQADGAGVEAWAKGRTLGIRIALGTGACTIGVVRRKGIRAEEGVEGREGGEGGRSIGFGFGFGFRFRRKPITVGEAVGWALCPTQVPGLSSLCSAALWSGAGTVVGRQT